MQVFVPIEVQENAPVVAAEREDDDSNRCFKSNDVSSQLKFQVVTASKMMIQAEVQI